MKKLVKVSEDGTVHEIYSEYFIDWKKDHAKMIPIDHPDDSITTSKLRNKVVTTEKINDSAVITTKIADSNVTTEKINDSAVATEKISDDAVVTSKIADSSVTTDKIAELNVTHEKLNEDMNLRGKVVIVDTPINSTENEEYPDTSSLSDVYTKTVIDQKLTSKSDISHTHSYNGLNDLPTTLKNPCSLTINGVSYDGENPVNIQLNTSVDALEDDINQIYIRLEDKSNIEHSHDESDITNLDKYTKSETDNLIVNKTDKLYVDNEINDLKATIAALEARIQILEGEQNV